MADTFVHRFHAPAAQRIAATVHWVIRRPIAMRVEVHPTVIDRLERLIRNRLHAPQATEHLTNLTQIQTGQGCFGPRLSSPGIDLLACVHRGLSSYEFASPG